MTEALGSWKVIILMAVFCRTCVITEAPSLTSIANVRGEDSMVDIIDKVWKREIISNVGANKQKC